MELNRGVRCLLSLRKEAEEEFVARVVEAGHGLTHPPISRNRVCLQEKVSAQRRIHERNSSKPRKGFKLLLGWRAGFGTGLAESVGIFITLSLDPTAAA